MCTRSRDKDQGQNEDASQMTKNVNEYLVYNKYKTRATKHEPTNYNRLQKEFNERQEHGRDIKQHGT